MKCFNGNRISLRFPLLNVAFSLVAGDVTSVLRDTTNLEQVREEAKERRKRRKKKRSGSTLIASVFSGEFPLPVGEYVWSGRRYLRGNVGGIMYIVYIFFLLFFSPLAINCK